MSSTHNSGSKVSACKKLVYLNFKQPEWLKDFVKKSLIAVKFIFDSYIPQFFHDIRSISNEGGGGGVLLHCLQND